MLLQTKRKKVRRTISLQPVDILKDKIQNLQNQKSGMVIHPELQDVRTVLQTSTPQVSTAQAATQSQKKLVNKEAGENIYVEVPEIPIKYLVSNKEIQDHLSEHYAKVDALRHQTDFADEYDLEQARWRVQDMDASDAAYKHSRHLLIKKSTIL